MVGRGPGSGGRGGGWGKKEVEKSPGLRNIKVRVDVERGRDSQESWRGDTTRGSSSPERGQRHKDFPLE